MPVLDAQSGHAINVSDVKGKRPRGVTVDDNGSIYVCHISSEIGVCLEIRRMKDVL